MPSLKPPLQLLATLWPLSLSVSPHQPVVGQYEPTFKLCQRREALRDQDRAQREEDASRQQPAGEPPALQQWLEDHLATPLPEMEQRPIIPLHHCVMVENPRASQAPTPHQRPLTRGQSFQPRGGGLPELPQEAPPLNAPIQDWVKFIQTYQNRYSGLDKSSKLSRMFPGVLGVSKHPDDDEWEIGPPSAQRV
ncbi:hypothetical protein EDD17DRAFT_1760039 [Pisolithus thermaeus]|nr:hypothetical protein EDD17DRAFT_1760039 [Pisolithus thermaeus]